MGTKSALITGITGQDGSYLAEFLLNKGYNVYGLIRRSTQPRSILPEIVPISGDILDRCSLRRAIQISQPDEIYNLAGFTHVGESFSNPELTLETTGYGLHRLLSEVLKEVPYARVYQASSSEMFGNVYNEYGPLDEMAPFSPVSPYGNAKLLAHRTANDFREQGLYVACGILFNHESPRRGMDFVTRKITRGFAEIRTGKRDYLELGNLDVYRDWGYAPDYVEAMWKMLQQPFGDDYVVGTGIAYTIADFIKLTHYHTGLGGHWSDYIKVNEEFKRPNDIDILLSRPTKALAELNWKSSTPFDALVLMMVEAEIKGLENEA